MAQKRPPDSSAGGKDPLGHAGGFTLDLSAGRTQARRRRKTQAVVTETIDLSTKTKPAPAPQPAVPPAAAAADGPARGRREGHSLADLLDPETLARLRGEG
jgi:hypothetical protein